MIDLSKVVQEALAILPEDVRFDPQKHGPLIQAHVNRTRARKKGATPRLPLNLPRLQGVENNLFIPPRGPWATGGR